MSKRFARHWQRTLLSYGMCEKSWQRFEAENFDLENGDRSGKFRKSDPDARRIDKKDRESSETSGISYLICAIKS